LAKASRNEILESYKGSGRIFCTCHTTHIVTLS